MSVATKEQNQLSVKMIDVGEIMRKAGATEMCGLIMRLFAEQPKSWRQDTHTVDHDCGLRLWTCNGKNNFRLYGNHFAECMLNQVEYDLIWAAYQRWIMTYQRERAENILKLALDGQGVYYAA
jgi:hypothetical protein